MYLQAKYKKVIECHISYHFETVISKKNFSCTNFTFVTQKLENRNAPIELVTQSANFYFLTSS